MVYTLRNESTVKLHFVGIATMTEMRFRPLVIASRNDVTIRFVGMRYLQKLFQIFEKQEFSTRGKFCFVLGDRSLKCHIAT
jgi:hypothetical protein